MSSFEVTIAVLFVILVSAVIGYKIITDNIIKEQSKEIAALRKEVAKAEAVIGKTSKKVVYKTAPQIIEIHDHRIDEKNVPKFGDI